MEKVAELLFSTTNIHICMDLMHKFLAINNCSKWTQNVCKMCTRVMRVLTYAYSFHSFIRLFVSPIRFHAQFLIVQHET